MTKALVLSGGGLVGIAWQTGIAAALAEQGVDLTAADWILGTSAGSSVGAQLAKGRDMVKVLDRYRAKGGAPTAPGAKAEPVGRAPEGVAGPPNLAKLMEIMALAAARGGSPEKARAAVGAYALEAETVPEEVFIAGFAHLDKEGGWPGRYQCTAVDALDGALVVWDGSQSGVEVSRAVASSCAMPGIFPPVTINGRRYIDGGMRSGTSADLATGHDKVLIVTMTSPAQAAAMAGDTRFGRVHKRNEVERAILEESGAAVETLAPDDEAEAAFGINRHDSLIALGAAEHGFRQGQLEADRLRDFWS